MHTMPTRVYKTSPEKRERRRRYYRNQRQKNPVRFYNLPLPDTAIEVLYARLNVNALDKKSVIRELAKILTDTLSEK